MVNAEQVQNRRVKVMNVDWIADDVVREVVGLSIGNSRPDAAAGQELSEAPGMMIAAVIPSRKSPWA